MERKNLKTVMNFNMSGKQHSLRGWFIRMVTFQSVHEKVQNACISLYFILDSMTLQIQKEVRCWLGVLSSFKYFVPCHIISGSCNNNKKKKKRIKKAFFSWPVTSGCSVGVMLAKVMLPMQQSSSPHICLLVKTASLSTTF